MPVKKTLTYEWVRDAAQAKAAAHARKTSDPDRFMAVFTELFRAYQIKSHEFVDPGCAEIPRAPWDTVRVAAEVEALAAVRLLAAFWHASTCRCGTCRLTRTRPVL
jgi:hypothetical protein